MSLNCSKHKYHLGEPSWKKTGKIWEKFPNGGGGNFVSKKSQFQFGNFKNPGGSQFFKIVPISNVLQLFCNITFIKNYETYYRSARVQVFKNFEWFWSILNYLGLSRTISDYLGPSWTISATSGYHYQVACSRVLQGVK